MNNKTNNFKRVFVATDKSGEQHIHQNKPERKQPEWVNKGYIMFCENKHILNQTWEDEPQEFELVPVGLVDKQAEIIKKQLKKLNELQKQLTLHPEWER